MHCPPLLVHINYFLEKAKQKRRKRERERLKCKLNNLLIWQSWHNAIWFISGPYLELDPAGYLVLRLLPTALSREHLMFKCLTGSWPVCWAPQRNQTLLNFSGLQKKLFPALSPGTSKWDFSVSTPLQHPYFLFWIVSSKQDSTTGCPQWKLQNRPLASEETPGNNIFTWAEVLPRVIQNSFCSACEKLQL